MKDKKGRPDRSFSMERDGFFGEYFRAGNNAFPGKCMIAFGGSVGKFLLSRMVAREFVASGMDVLILAYHGEPGLPKLLNNYAVPKAAPKLDTHIQFWVGTDEWRSRLRDLKWTRQYLPQIETVKIPGMMHGEFVLMHPEEFTKKALAFLQ